MGDEVGRVGELQVVGADAVAEAAAVGVDGAVVVVGGADGGEGRGRGDARRAEAQVLGAGRHDRVDVHAVALGETGGGLADLLLRWFVLLQSPGPETASAHLVLLTMVGLAAGTEAAQFLFELADAFLVGGACFALCLQGFPVLSPVFQV